MKEYNYCPLCATQLKARIIAGRNRKFCPSCNFIDYKNPLPVATAVAVQNNKLLLIKRGLAPRKGTWAAPAGFIEIGETPEEACLRELKEETGMSGEIIRLIGATRLQDMEIYGDMLLIKYLVQLEEGNPIPGDEVEEVKFFAFTELPDHYIKRFKDTIAELEKG
jgi:ADP-ribose pyrophosphatase YjhB (NUDIX family)